MRHRRSKQAFDVHRTLPNPHSANGRPTPLEPLKAERSGWKKWLISLLLTLLGISLLIGIWDAVNISRASKSVFGSGNLFSLISESEAKSQNNRINLLLVGYSVDDPGHPGASLTDSIILLSMSTEGHSGYMLSIPRDLY